MATASNSPPPPSDNDLYSEYLYAFAIVRSGGTFPVDRNAKGVSAKIHAAHALGVYDGKNSAEPPATSGRVLHSVKRLTEE